MFARLMEGMGSSVNLRHIDWLTNGHLTYYRLRDRREPVMEFIDSLPVRDQAAIDLAQRRWADLVARLNEDPRTGPRPIGSDAPTTSDAP